LGGSARQPTGPLPRGEPSDSPERLESLDLAGVAAEAGGASPGLRGVMVEAGGAQGVYIASANPRFSQRLVAEAGGALGSRGMWWRAGGLGGHHKSE
jgi:hypothetical protein